VSIATGSKLQIQNCKEVIESDMKIRHHIIGCRCACEMLLAASRSTTYVHAAYCYRLSSVVCRSVILVSPAKTAAPIEMPFGLRTRVSPRNHLLDGGPAVLRDVAMATTFWLLMGYNFSCMIASDMLYDSSGGFLGSSYPMKTG